MLVELELTKANRLKLAQAFRDHPRVDLSIECAIEGQMGGVFVDDPQQPAVYRLAQGPFWYLAGDARSAAAAAVLQELPAYTLLMLSPSDWIEAAQEMYGTKLHELGRYSFSADGLSPEHLGRLLDKSRFRDQIRPIDRELALQFMGQPEHFVDLSAFESADDFVARGIGFCLPIGERIVAAAYASLVCSRGIEISIFVESRHRQRGIATALGSRLVLTCLERGLEPHWDAANAESCKLAKKLGYQPAGVYLAYYREE